MRLPARTLVVLLALVSLSTSNPHAAPVARATSYTPDQAWQGRLAYYRSCAECHGGELGGVFGPALAGGNDNLQYQSVADVYDYMAAHMPHGNPESLQEGQYVAIMAFLMQAHGLARGPRALTRASIEADHTLLGDGR